MIWNRYVVIRNRRGSAERLQRDIRRLLIGCSDNRRFLTLMIEPTTWLLITGWESTSAERKIWEKAWAILTPTRYPETLTRSSGI